MRSAVLALVVLVLPLIGQDKVLPVSACTVAGQFVPRGLPGLQWHPDGQRFSYLKREGKDVELRAQSVDGETSTVLKWSALSAALIKAGVKGATPQVLMSLKWRSAGGLDLAAGGRRWIVKTDPVTVQVLVPMVAGDEAAPVVSPDEKHTAYVKAHDIYVLQGQKNEVRVTSDGSADLTHGVAVSRVEFGITDGLWWDPTSRRVAFYEENFRPIKAYPYIDFASRPAKLVDGRYPMAGQPCSVVRVGVFDVANKKTVWLDTDVKRDQYLTNVTWHPSGETVVVAHVNRAQNRCEVVEYDAASGKRLRLLFVESDHEWVEPEHGPIWLPDGSGDFLWVSYRNGHRHFWHYRGDGRLVSQVTKGAFDMQSFVRFSPDKQGFYWETSGPDPLHKHLYYASLDGKTQRAVTAGRGHHGALLSPDAAHMLDVHENLELPQATDLVRTGDGAVLRRVHAAKDPFDGYQRCKESFFKVKNDKGEDLHGYLVLPPKDAPGSKRPVINYVYGGPHSQLVSDRWISGFSRWTLWLHAMAQRGYVCFIIDGRGTTNRGIAWQQAVFRNLGALEAEDQIAGLKHVLARDDTDPGRVGVTGWSYGGFMTCTMMTRKSKWYRAGVAGAPVTDWAYYETGYGERYMDTPAENPEGYKTADPGAHVENIKGRLLVVHGSGDDTVMWQSSIAFLDKCIDAGVPVDYMAYPGQLHGLRGKDFAHFVNKMTDYFDLHVRGAAGKE